jgi:hypothetical protein
MSAMRPFRNSGWPHYETMQSILPSINPRGTHAYRAALAPPPNPSSNEPEAEADTGVHNRNESGTSGITMADDDVVGSSTLVDSASTDVDEVAAAAAVNLGKRTHQMMSSDSGVSLPHTGSVLTTMESRGSIAGGSNVGSNAGASNARAGGSTPGCSKAGCSKAGPSQVSGSTRREPKMSPTAAVVGMQGSLNRLTDVVERTFASTEEPGVAARRDAIRLVQVNQDGLSSAQKAGLVELFMEKPVFAETYAALTDMAVRRRFVKKRLSEVVVQDELSDPEVE